MRRLDKYIHFYIGCHTNKGKLVGVRYNRLLIQAEDKQNLQEFDMDELGSSLFLYLQKLDELNEEESRELIKKGIALGRPNGYTFSNEGFLFLISLHVDLFGLIASGYARSLRDGNLTF